MLAPFYFCCIHTHFSVYNYREGVIFLAKLKAGDLFFLKKGKNAICMKSYQINVKLCEMQPFKVYCVLRVYKKENMILFIDMEELKEGFYLLNKENLYLTTLEIPDYKIVDHIPNSEVKEVLSLLHVG